MSEGKAGRHRRPAANRWSLGLIAAVALSAAAPAVVVPHPSSGDRFDTVFAVAGEPAALHYRAEFGGAGPKHIVEVWRDRDRRLKRVTDTAVDTYVAHRPDGDFNMLVVDHRKRIVTEINRTSLYRLGNFTDWFDLAHGLRHPKGTYRIVAVAPNAASVAKLAPAPSLALVKPAVRVGVSKSVAAILAAAPKLLDRCLWYDLIEGTRTTRVCWSPHDRLPLLMLSGDGAVIWRVTATDHAPLAKDVFRIRNKGYVRINANRDAERD